jgi:Flp pilus assembly protein TadB
MRLTVIELPSLRGVAMWLSKPIYESVPYFYLLAGAIALAASLYLDYWYWPSICFVVGLFSLLGGIVVLLKRRDHRQRRLERVRETDITR